LHADRVAALGAEVGCIGVVRAALGAKHFAGMERIGDYGSAAVLTSGAQVMQSLEVTAFALPVPDCVIDKLQLGYAPEIGDREHRLEYRLQTRIVALTRQTVHLQEAVIGTLLHFDQIRNLNRCRDLREVESLAEGNFLFSHY
jgi:hypothetical protein